MTKSKFKNVCVTAIKTIVPEKVINIDDEEKYFQNCPKKFIRAKKMIGFGKRHVVDEYTTSLDLAYEAGKQLFNDLNIDSKSIDTLLFLSQSRDYKLPTSANILHGLLDLSENCAALDISQGCSGYVYALWLAHSLISSGASNKLLLLSADTLSRYSYEDNRLIAPIFGDSASATLLEYNENNNIAYFDLGSKGSLWDKLCIPAGGDRIPIDENILKTDYVDNDKNRWNLSHLYMDGLGVFNFTMEFAPKCIEDLLQFSSCKKNDISMFALHQANKQIVSSIAKKAELPLEKTPVNTFTEYGNTACNSIATVLSHNLTSANCSKVLCCSFGVGLSWASAILDLSHIRNLGISDMTSEKTVFNNKEYWINKFINKGE